MNRADLSPNHAKPQESQSPNPPKRASQRASRPQSPPSTDSTGLVLEHLEKDLPQVPHGSRFGEAEAPQGQRRENANPGYPKNNGIQFYAPKENRCKRKTSAKSRSLPVCLLWEGLLSHSPQLDRSMSAKPEASQGLDGLKSFQLAKAHEDGINQSFILQHLRASHC